MTTTAAATALTTTTTIWVKCCRTKKHFYMSKMISLVTTADADAVDEKVNLKVSYFFVLSLSFCFLTKMYLSLFLCFFFKNGPSFSLFSLFQNSSQNTNVLCTMTGFKPRTYGVGSDRYTDCATATALSFSLSLSDTFLLTQISLSSFVSLLFS